MNARPGWRPNCRRSRWLPWDDNVVPYRRGVLAVLVFATVLTTNAEPVVIGSKKFTESYVLGEIAKRVLNDTPQGAEHRQGMGGTIILWEALRGGQIDVYPEYTGTIAQEILKTDQRLSIKELRDALNGSAIGITEPLGFNNTYAL